MSYVTDRKRKPPMDVLQLELMNVCAKAQTVGARRALALAVRDGKFDDGRKLSVHWAVLKQAKDEYNAARDALMAKLGAGLVGPEKDEP